MERNTRQRDAIRQAIERADRPLGPQEIHARAVRSVRGLGLATVYRTVRAGIEEGWLVAVELPGEPPRYERAGKAHHHHFECRECHGVYDVDGCPGNLRSLTPAGFKLETHEVVLYGLCEKCNA